MHPSHAKASLTQCAPRIEYLAQPTSVHVSVYSFTIDWIGMAVNIISNNAVAKKDGDMVVRVCRLQVKYYNGQNYYSRETINSGTHKVKL